MRARCGKASRFWGAVLVLLCAGGVMHGEEAPEPWVAKVNGEPIAVREFERRVLGNRAAAYSYFAGKYGATDSAEFWTTSYGGEAPLAWVKERALQECVRIKVEQILARHKGVVEDISYGAFLERLAQENERRRKALELGQPIYGPMQYEEDQFFSYLLSNVVIEVKRRLAQGELRASDEELREYYEVVKDKWYARGARVRVWTISASFRKGGETATRDQARARMEEVKAKLDQGARFEELARRYNEEGTLGEVAFDDASARFDATSRPALREAAVKLSVGESSGIIEDRGAFCIAKCISREALGCAPFEEVQSNVRLRYTDEKYEEMIADLVRKATVEINRPVYDAITVR